ncbi:MAG: RNA polymerase sigma factor [Armatimonadetes bacterium]|nr:RNA polymerase sigma factor [Armatimonadota bacterium]
MGVDIGFASAAPARRADAERTAVDEVALIQRCLAGDPEAFAPVVAQYRDRLVDLAYRMLGDLDEAEAAVQDAFVRAYESLSAFRHESGIGTWLYRITVNECLMRLRRTRRTVPLSVADRLQDVAGRAHERQIEAADRAHTILALLPATLRVVLVMREMHQMPYDEIAAATGAPVGTVRAATLTAAALSLWLYGVVGYSGLGHRAAADAALGCPVTVTSVR